MEIQITPNAGDMFTDIISLANDTVAVKGVYSVTFYLNSEKHVLKNRLTENEIRKTIMGSYKRTEDD